MVDEIQLEIDRLLTKEVNSHDEKLRHEQEVRDFLQEHFSDSADFDDYILTKD